MRGLKRIFGSQKKGWKITWTIAVLIFVAATLFNLISLLERYFSYHTVTLHQVDYKNNGPFPSITVCNMNPFSNITLIKNETDDDRFNTSSYGAYLRDLQTLKQSDPDVNATLFKHLASREGYFQNLEPDEVSTLGPTKSTFILTCGLQHLSHSKTSEVRCSNISDINDPHHFKCYRIVVDGHFSEKVTLMQLVLYLDDLVKTVHPTGVQESHHSSHTYGAKVVVHEHFTLPDMEKAIDLQPGVSVNIRFQTIDRELLPTPYGKCVEHPQDASYSDVIGLSYNYSRHACQLICQQAITAEECGCLSPFLPILKNAKFANLNLSYCGQLKGDLDTIEKNVKCMEDIALNSRHLAHIVCPYCRERCKRFEYDMTYTSTNWPADSYHIAFYNEFIKPRAIASNFAVYEEIEKLMIKNPGKGWAMLNQVDLIEKNFIRINVIRGGNGIQRLLEIPKTSRSELLSGLGGSFSLFIGITVVAVVEVIEFFYDLCCVCRQKRKSKVERRAENYLSKTETESNGIETAGRGPENATRDPQADEVPETRL
jgi:hypothetical protein